MATSTTLEAEDDPVIGSSSTEPESVSPAKSPIKGDNPTHSMSSSTGDLNSVTVSEAAEPLTSLAPAGPFMVQTYLQLPSGQTIQVQVPATTFTPMQFIQLPLVNQAQQPQVNNMATNVPQVVLPSTQGIQTVPANVVNQVSSQPSQGVSMNIGPLTQGNIASLIVQPTPIVIANCAAPNVNQSESQADTKQAEIKEENQSTQEQRETLGKTNKPLRHYKCDYCEKMFPETQTSNLSRHMRLHTGERPFKCKFCEKSFTNSGCLKSHMRLHTGERPYKCGTCGTSFIQNYHLVRHLRTHTGEKPYKCDMCEKSFAEKGYLARHMTRHTGEKPYICGICGNSFTEKGHLVSHMKIHTGERPHKCELCGKSFTEKSTLVNHIKVHTGEKR